MSARRHGAPWPHRCWHDLPVSDRRVHEVRWHLVRPGELRKVTHDAELEKILRDYATPGPNPIACLRDQAPMNRRVIEDVEIDVCESCGGFWVDGGELQELVSAAKDVESSGDPERPLISELEPRDIAILAWIAPGTFTKFQHETRRPTFR